MPALPTPKGDPPVAHTEYPSIETNTGLGLMPDDAYFEDGSGGNSVNATRSSKTLEIIDTIVIRRRALVRFPSKVQKFIEYTTTTCQNIKSSVCKCLGRLSFRRIAIYSIPRPKVLRLTATSDVA